MYQGIANIDGADKIQTINANKTSHKRRKQSK